MRLIDAKEFYRQQVERCGTAPMVGSCTSDNSLLLIELRNAPTVDAEQAKRGEWLLETWAYHGARYERMYCSACKAVKDGEETPYCPNCGAKMEGV